MARRIKDPDPELLVELFEALDNLEAAARALARQKRELWPAIRARARAVACVRAVWKEIGGKKAGPPDRPLLDAIAERRAQAPLIQSPGVPETGNGKSKKSDSGKAEAERARRKADRKPALRKIRGSGKAALAELEAAAASAESRPDGAPITDGC